MNTALLKSRLEAMNAKSPFKIEYNQSLENVIKSQSTENHLSD
jgi:membrane-bound lytic murein transglycosylase D